MTIPQRLKQIFGYYVVSADAIPSFIDRMSKAGKFDSPKQILIFAELLKRLADLEEKVSRLEEERLPVLSSPPEEQIVLSAPVASAELSWKELQNTARALGVFKVGLTRDELKILIQTHSK
jgi:hypothetical protein